MAAQVASPLESANRDLIAPASGTQARNGLLGWGTVICAAAVVAWCAWRGPPALPVATATLFIALLAWLQRAGLVRLCGPVLGYDLVRTARRKQFILLRCFYGVFLLVAFFLVYASWAFERDASLHDLFSPAALDAKRLADFASSFFLAFLAIQFLAACALTPIYTAGAIPEDRACRTLEFLLATDLRSREIVLSLLLSRLANLGLVILTGLPVLSLLELLGGVDPALVLVGFAVTGLTMLSLASLSILVSVYARQPRQAISWTFGWATAYLATAGLCWLLLLPSVRWATWPSTDTWTSPVTVTDAVNWVNAGNPISHAILLWQGIGPMTPLGALLPRALLHYALFHGVLSVVCLAWATARLRAEVLRERPVTVQTLVGPRRRRRPKVGKRPLLWKELFVDSSSELGRRGQLIVATVILATFIPELALVCYQGNKQWVFSNYPELLNGWVRIAGSFVGCVMLGLVATRAAGSVAGERDGQTLDSLLGTPAGGEGILLAKWLGSIAGPRRGWLWLALIWLVGIATGTLCWWCVPLFVAAWLFVAGFLAALGLWFSMTTRTAQRALLGTLLAAGAFCAGHWLVWMFVIPLISGLTGSGSALGWLTEFQALGMTPPLTLAFLAYPTQAVGDWTWADWQWTLVPLFRGALFWAIGAAVFGTLAALRFRAAYGVSALPAPGTGSGGHAPNTSTPRPNPPPQGGRERARHGKWKSSLAQAGVIGAGVAVFWLGWRVTEGGSSAASLAAAVAEADRLDLRWRLEELEADRRVVPEEENSAFQVPLIPDERGRWMRRWYPGMQWPTPELEEALRDLSLDVALNEKQYRLLKSNLDAVQPALAQARQLVNFPYGRYPLTHSKDGLSTLLPHAQRNRAIANLLSYDALCRTHEGDIDGALASCQACVNAGRSLGDEPFFVCQLIRMACRGMALERAERALAHGEPSEEALARFQHALDDEEREPLFLCGCRGERADLDRLCSALESGDVPPWRFLQNFYWESNSTPRWMDRIMAYIGISTRAQHAALLRFCNEMVETAKLAPERQENAMADLTTRAARLPSAARSLVVGSRGLFAVRMARSWRFRTAQIRCAIAMLAMERYRRGCGHWPQSLEALVPAQLKVVPLDPYDGKPLRYRQLDDGILIYAIGPDLKDDGGRFAANQRTAPWTSKPSEVQGLDIGVRLWDVKHRHQPPKPAAR
jgi:ABC-type transport system involved in multi-copper enzyme maturation permease subunit